METLLLINRAALVFSVAAVLYLAYLLIEKNIMNKFQRELSARVINLSSTGMSKDKILTILSTEGFNKEDIQEKIEDLKELTQNSSKKSNSVTTT